MYTAYSVTQVYFTFHPCCVTPSPCELHLRDVAFLSGSCSVHHDLSWERRTRLDYSFCHLTVTQLIWATGKSWQRGLQAIAGSSSKSSFPAVEGRQHFLLCTPVLLVSDIQTSKQLAASGQSHPHSRSQMFSYPWGDPCLGTTVTTVEDQACLLRFMPVLSLLAKSCLRLPDLREEAGDSQA